MGGCQRTSKSTSGVFLSVEGPNTFFPIAAISKRQTSVSHSTPEAEIVAGAHGLRHAGLPGQIFWDAIVHQCQQRDPRSPVQDADHDTIDVGTGGPLHMHGDNEAILQVCRTGRNPTMRHLGRTHGISITWFKIQALK